MNSWSRARKRIVLSIVILAVIVLVGLPAYFFFYQTPTCSDGVMNSDETGVDCGGSCQHLCSAESLPLIMRGDPRILMIATSTYEVVAVLENPNPAAEIYRAQYTLKLFDLTSALPVKVIEGATFIPKGQTLAIFEGPFTLGEEIMPARATLEWYKDSLVWRKNGNAEPELKVNDVKLSKTDLSPRLEANLENTSLGDVSNIDLIALISDEEGNIFAASKTFVDSLSSRERAPLIFSWPRAFKSAAIGIQIIPRIFPDSSFLR